MKFITTTKLRGVQLKVNLFCLFSVLAFFNDFEVSAQQDAQYTQYMYNTMSINPAYAGTRGQLSLAGLYRSQWVGLDGAPETQTLNIHSPIGERGIGLGLSVINDKIGPSSEVNIDVDFSYTIQATQNGKLSFGLKGSANFLDIDFNRLSQEIPGLDPFLQNVENRFSPNIGAGAYYHTEKFYAGLSVPRFWETRHFDELNLTTSTEELNLYGIVGYVWDLSPSIKFKPAMLVKVVSGSPLQTDLSASFLFNEKFVAGVAYRWDAAFSGLAGFQLNRSIFAGLAYDREITELGGTSFNDGSFELVMIFDVFKRAPEEFKSPRFF